MQLRGLQKVNAFKAVPLCFACFRAFVATVGLQPAGKTLQEAKSVHTKSPRHNWESFKE